MGFFRRGRGRANTTTTNGSAYNTNNGGSYNKGGGSFDDGLHWLTTPDAGSEFSGSNTNLAPMNGLPGLLTTTARPEFANFTMQQKRSDQDWLRWHRLLRHFYLKNDKKKLKAGFDNEADECVLYGLAKLNEKLFNKYNASITEQVAAEPMIVRSEVHEKLTEYFSKHDPSWVLVSTMVAAGLADNGPIEDLLDWGFQHGYERLNEKLFNKYGECLSGFPPPKRVQDSIPESPRHEIRDAHRRSRRKSGGGNKPEPSAMQSKNSNRNNEPMQVNTSPPPPAKQQRKKKGTRGPAPSLPQRTRREIAKSKREEQQQQKREPARPKLTTGRKSFRIPSLRAKPKEKAVQKPQPAPARVVQPSVEPAGTWNRRGRARAWLEAGGKDCRGQEDCCETFKLDMAARNFGMCFCGHPKAAHDNKVIKKIAVAKAKLNRQRSPSSASSVYSDTSRVRKRSPSNTTSASTAASKSVGAGQHKPVTKKYSDLSKYLEDINLKFLAEPLSQMGVYSMTDLKFLKADDATVLRLKPIQMRKLMSHTKLTALAAEKDLNI